MIQQGYVIGIMTGTSLDAIDLALLNCSKKQPKPVVIETLLYEIPFALKQSLQLLCYGKQISLDTLGVTEFQFSHLLADAVLVLLQKAAFSKKDILVLGCHGQTIRHQPSQSYPFTFQLLNPHILAIRTQIPVVSDFRRADLALGGQGAPLAPLFHAMLWGRETPRAIVNIGGMSNISLLSENILLGFDTGPGNVLMDLWIQKNKGNSFDRAGEWASTAAVDPSLLTAFLSDPYFSLPPPKSTGFEYFNRHWLDNILKDYPSCSAAVVQATLLALTAQSIQQALNRYAQNIESVVVCGGGAHNTALLTYLEKLIDPVPLLSSTDYDPSFIEAIGFGYLAWQRLQGKVFDTRTLTGAKQPLLLGSITAVPNI